MEVVCNNNQDADVGAIVIKIEIPETPTVASSATDRRVHITGIP